MAGQPSIANRQLGWSRRRWLWVLGFAVVAFDVVILLLDRRMSSTGGPSIIGFEFAASRAHAARILAEWGDTGRDAARLSLWLDYGFMLSYGAFFTLAGLATREVASRRGWRGLATAGVVVPFFAAVAALFDAAENVALLLTLGGNGGSLAPPFATACASLKFALIAIAILYVLLGLGRRLPSARDN